VYAVDRHGRLVLVADGRWPPRRERVASGPMLVAGAW